jgi:hypothetical protein
MTSPDFDPETPRRVFVADAEPITTAEAAITYFVTTAAVRNWVKRGKLEIIGKRGRWNLFDPVAVHAAATTRRPQHRGTGGRYGTQPPTPTEATPATHPHRPPGAD